MHVAVAVGTLLLGGWVLDSTPKEEIPMPATAPAAPSTPERKPEIPLFAPAPQAQPGVSLQERMQRHRSFVVPETPTSSPQDTGPRDEDAVMKPAAPTSDTPLQDIMLGLGMNRSQRGRTPLGPPTSRRQFGSAFHPMAQANIAQQSERAMPYMSGSSLAAPSSVEKAFSGYRPTSGVSPYMNLYRTDNLGTIDNYTTLVRPQVEQRFLNQQLGQDVHGLQRGYLQQGAALHNLNRETRTLEGVSTPQFYQNYGPYYQFGQ